MTQTQLLAIDTILPTILGFAGLVFLGAGVWPLAVPGRAFGARSAMLSLVGLAAVAVAVWLWLAVIGMAGNVSPAQPRPSVSAAPPPTPAASVPATAGPSVAGAGPAASASPAASAGASPSSSAASASPTPAPTAIPPTPTIPPNLTPVPAATFQPDNTPAHAAVVGVQAFEHGSMLYRDDLKQIYVMTLDQKFKAYPDTWVEGKNPDLGNLTPVASKVRPGRGFGWLWASNPDIRQTLGLALTGEQGFTGSISGDGTTTIIRADVTYAFNKDGTWALK